MSAQKAFARAAELAAASKKDALVASVSLAAAIKNQQAKSKEFSALESEVQLARARRDAAAITAHQVFVDAERTKTLNSAKVLSAQKAASVSEDELKVKIAAAAIASKNLKVAAETRSSKQNAAIVAVAAFEQSKAALKKCQLSAAQSEAAAHDAESLSDAAARVADEAIRTFMSRKQ
jgi:hypothetical protein